MGIFAVAGLSLALPLALELPVDNKCRCTCISLEVEDCAVVAVTEEASLDSARQGNQYLVVSIDVDTGSDINLDRTVDEQEWSTSWDVSTVVLSDVMRGHSLPQAESCSVRTSGRVQGLAAPEL